MGRRVSVEATDRDVFCYYKEVKKLTAGCVRKKLRNQPRQLKKKNWTPCGWMKAALRVKVRSTPPKSKAAKRCFGWWMNRKKKWTGVRLFYYQLLRTLIWMNRDLGDQLCWKIREKGVTDCTFSKWKSKLIAMATDAKLMEKDKAHV